MRILLVEDNLNLSNSIQYQLVREGFYVDCCADGEESLYYINQRCHDLILLDCMLPSLDGISVLKKLRKDNNNTPVIMITALGTLEDKVTGLNMGADDYIVKPFEFEELLARIYCIARRPRKIETGITLSFSSISYHPEEGTLTGQNRSCLLSKREGALLEVFIRNPNQTLSRNILLSKIWGPESEVEDGNLDNYIYFIRRRLRAVDNNVTIKTIRGIGYRLEELFCG